MGFCGLLSEYLEAADPQSPSPEVKVVLLGAVASLALENPENQELLVKGNVCRNVVKVMNERKTHREIQQNGYGVSFR